MAEVAGLIEVHTEILCEIREELLDGRLKACEVGALSLNLDVKCAIRVGGHNHLPLVDKVDDISDEELQESLDLRGQEG